ncbi:uncharacterized protein LOC129958706 [Argiope bruennichi]|uniref:uncharacterized protein LOC129958706 n=1 Tax=Argiope bruennichi TaxID=94029 RepID=UPI0024952D14|nr:uncharacterized protein LOC129958706 [Argiope bruennichi]
MDLFGFKSRKYYVCFNLKFLTLILVLISCTWAQENIPSFNFTCNSTGLYVKIAFSKPFIGIAYAKGHRFDPLCSMTQSSVLDGFLTLPLTACGTYVQETNHPWITNTIIIQQNPLVWTTDDLEKSVICSLPRSFENFLNSSVLLDQIYESHSLPPTYSSSDIELGLAVFPEDNDKIFDYTSTHLTVFQLLNRTIYKDVGVKSCIAHDEEILDGNASIHQITNPEGCFTDNSENSSSLMIHYTETGIWADIKIKTLEMDSSDHIYLACEIFLCRTKCNCSEIDQQLTGYPISVISHKLTKRSTGQSSEILSLKQYQARTRYLKSTVQALMNSIIEQRKQNDKKSKLRKRLMRLDDSSSLSETDNSGSHTFITSTETFSPEPLSTMFNNIEPHLIDIYDDSDSEPHLIDIHDDSDSEPHLIDIHDDSDPEPHLIDIHDDSDSDSELHMIDDYDDSDPGESHHDSREEPSATSETFTVDSNMAIVTLSKEFKDNGTKIAPDEELQEKGMTNVSNNVVSSVNDGAENIKITTTAISVFPPLEGANDHLGNCVPRLRFVIVIVVLGFSIGCLLLVTCGMVLYIRKEKKRNKLNDFLLYSIGF